MIEIRDLTYEYVAEGSDETKQRRRALQGIRLEIKEGSFVAVVGANGSGKSTLARCLNGLLLPTQGHVYVNGMDTADEAHIWDIRSTVAMVFQNPDNQIVSSIVEEDVAFGPENLGVAPEEIRRRVDAALQAVGMTAFRERAPHMLSGGQKQRIALAGALAMQPACIVLDEPTAMLDPSGRQQVMEIIRKQHARGTTIILITHFMEEAASADRVLVMRAGRVTADLPPAELFDDHGALDAAGLELPPAAALREALNDRGAALPRDLLKEEDLIEAICRLQ